MGFFGMSLVSIYLKIRSLRLPSVIPYVQITLLLHQTASRPSSVESTNSSLIKYALFHTSNLLIIQ